MQPGSFATTEHALFGINHSGTVANQIAKAGSDGLFFGMDGDGGVSPTSSTLRDFAVLQGRGANTPFLMLTDNSTFGPAPLLGDRFDNADPGFSGLFPSTPSNGDHNHLRPLGTIFPLSAPACADTIRRSLAGRRRSP